MKKIVIFLLLLCLSFSVLARDIKLPVIYKSFTFYVPVNPEAIAFLGTNSDIFIVKYSKEPGQKIIGFSIDSELDSGNCSPEEFFEMVLGREAAVCNGAVNTFRSIFARGRSIGSWSSVDYKFFYFIGSGKSTVFYVTNNNENQVLKLESNFLTKEEMKSLLSKYLD